MSPAILLVPAAKESRGGKVMRGNSNAFSSKHYYIFFLEE